MKIKLHWQILIALLLGGVFGFFFAPHVHWVTWMGDMFLRALKMLIIPLLLTSISSGIANIGSGEDLGRLGAKTLGYYALTSLFAATIGLLVVNVFKPGVGANLKFVDKVEGLEAAKESFGSTLLNIIPENIFAAFVNQDTLSIIFFAILIGFFTIRLSETSKELILQGINAGFELMMEITLFIIKFTPLGVFGLVAGVVAEQASDLVALSNIVQRLGLFVITVIIGLLIHALIVMPLLLKFLGKIDPLKHLKTMTSPLLTAFSTASSSATLPMTMETIELESGVSNKITSFVLPLGATINMDGTALYECVAALFIAQAYGLDLTFMQQILVIMTALLVSIGAAGIPMAGLVMMSIVLSAAGLPMEGVGLILAVETILGMSRTAVNVWSDSCGAVIVASSEGETLNYNYRKVE